MKKLKFLLPLILLFLVSNVYAKTTKNGIAIDDSTKTTTDLSCKYAENLILINYAQDHYEVTRYKNGKEIEKMPFSTIPTEKQLKQYKFIRSDDSFDCPKHIILDGDKIIDTTNDDNDHRPNTGYVIEDLDKKNSSCVGACDGIYEDVSNASSEGIALCTEKGIKNTFRFLGYLLLIVKIVVPLILIVIGVVDYSKAIVTGSQDAVKKATTTLIARIACGLIIFLLPSILDVVFNLVRPYKKDAGQFANCSKCLFTPTKCQ